MHFERKCFFALGILSTVFAVASWFVIAALEQLAGLAYMDMTSALQKEGLIDHQRWNQLCDDIGPVWWDLFGWAKKAIGLLFVILAIGSFAFAWMSERPSRTPAA